MKIDPREVKKGRKTIEIDWGDQINYEGYISKASALIKQYLIINPKPREPRKGLVATLLTYINGHQSDYEKAKLINSHFKLIKATIDPTGINGHQSYLYNLADTGMIIYNFVNLEEKNAAAAKLLSEKEETSQLSAEQLQEEISRKNSLISSLENTISVLREELQISKDKEAHTNKQLAALNIENSTAGNTISAQENKIQELQISLKRLNDEHTQNIESLKTSHNQKISALETNVSTLSLENERLKSDNERLKRDVFASSEEKITLSESNDKLRNDYTKSIQEKEDLREKANLLDTKFSTQQEQIQQLKTELKQKDNLISKLLSWMKSILSKGAENIILTQNEIDTGNELIQTATPSHHTSSKSNSITQTIYSKLFRPKSNVPKDNSSPPTYDDVTPTSNSTTPTIV